MTFDSYRYRASLPLLLGLLVACMALAALHKRSVNAGHTSLVARVSAALVSVPERASASILAGIATQARGLLFGSRLRAEQQELRARSELLRQRNALLEQGMQEQVTLPGLVTERLELERLRQTSLRARVIGRSSVTLHRSLLLNLGRRHGVANGDAVIVGAELIGRVHQSYATTCTVQCLTAPASRVAVRGVRSQQAWGVLAGGRADELLTTQSLPPGADVREGDVVITSGLDGCFPGGLIVGRVCRYHMSLDFATGNVTATAYVMPAADWRKAREVEVLIGMPRRGRG